MKILFALIGSRLFIPRGSVFLNPSYKTPSLILFVWVFFCYFLFLEERDIKVKIKYIFTPDFNRGGLRKATGLTSGEQSVKF